MDADGNSSLSDPHVRAVLDRLHKEARRQLPSVARQFLSNKILRRKMSLSEEVAGLKDFYVCLSPKQGTFAYLIARSLRARRIVEFGSSFGVSTIYHAAAVRDNGGGLVIGTEMEPTKVKAARANIAQAGLAEYVEIREGDAQQTLKDPGGPVDMALLDGFAELYLPILKLLTPHLRPGAVVLADNIFSFRKAVAPYCAYVRDPAHGFSSVTLLLADGTEYSVRL